MSGRGGIAMSEIKLIVRPFAMGTEKEAALKPLEEASEVRAAWQKIDECGIPEQCRDCDLHNTCEAIFALADEIADTIQASCNLAARYSIDLQSAMERCEQRNRERGRYPMEEKDVEPYGACVGDVCDCGGDCGTASAGVDNLRQKSSEEMNVEELIEALDLTRGSNYSCKKCLGDDWCKNFGYCSTCRGRLLELLKTAHEREMENAHKREEMQVDDLEAITREVAEKQRQTDDLAHECDGLRNRLAELNEAGITRLHRLLREAMGEAKNITHNARVYIENQRWSKDEHCGSRGSIGRNHGVNCGAQCAREYLLSVEQTAQEMSEREKVLERLRGYDVYMTESPSKNANRLFACITGNKDAEIACGNDIEAVRDKLIELLSYEKVPDGE